MNLDIIIICFCKSSFMYRFVIQRLKRKFTVQTWKIENIYCLLSFLSLIVYVLNLWT